MALDEIEKWIVDRYGPISHSAVDADLFSIYAAAVPVSGGVSIGMGPNRQLAIHDLYESLSLNRIHVTALSGFWRKRRDAIRKRGG